MYAAVQAFLPYYCITNHKNAETPFGNGIYFT